MTGCSVSTCKNTSEQGFSLHRFPKNEVLKEKWIKNSKIKRYWNGTRLCNEHFSEDQWLRKDGRRALKYNAIPTVFITPENTQLNQECALKEIEYENTTELSQEMVGKQNEQINELQNIILYYKARVFRLQKRIIILKHSNKLLSSKLVKQKKKRTGKLDSIFNADQIDAMQRYSNRFVPWSNKTVSTALRLRFTCGASGYNTLLQLHLPFPSIRTLDRRMQNLKFESGILYEVFDFLRIKVNSMNDFQKECILTMDEMDLKESADFCVTSGTFIGNVTLPKHTGVASRALVVMLAGITTRWKQIVAYYFTGSSINGSVFCDIVVEVIKCAHSIGLNVNSVTTDMGSSNQAMWRQFGIVIGRHSKTINSIPHPVNESGALYFLADACHLFKNIKQALIMNKTIEIPKHLQERYNLPTGPKHGKIVVCYVGTWSVYRPERGSFALEHIDPTLCTHIVYAFAGLNVTHDSIRPLDPWQDLTDDYGKGGYKRIVALKQSYPHLKVTLAIGGWNEGSENYSALVKDPARRGRFVVSVVEFIRKYKFDGLDLDWEFPAKRGGSPDDKLNFLYLVKELRSAFNKFKLLLTAAFGAGKDTIDVAYDVQGLSYYLDYIHLMCYDYHGAWDQKTGANAPLKSRDVLNVEYSIKYMIKLGAAPEKLIMGIPLYGRTFLLPESSVSSKKNPKLGAVAKNVGFQGPYTKENGFMGYNEICVELQNTTAGWVEHWDDESRTQFAISEDKLIAFDNDKSITEKVKFAVQQKLGGVMVWSIDTDDFQGDCGTENFPLMRKINRAVEEALEEIERDRENTIDQGSESDKKGGEGGTGCIEVNCILMCVILAFVSYLN